MKRPLRWAPLSRSTFIAPDVLVLGAGGIAGVAWLHGVLAGLSETTGVDFRRADCFVGTSAGSIMAARLCAGRPPRPPREPEAEPRPATLPAGEGSSRVLDRWSPLGSAVEPLASPFLDLALAAAGPGSALARRLVLALSPRGDRTHDQLATDLDRVRARFDGRLRVCCVQRSSGRRIVFGAPGAPDTTVGQAVAASCSIPGMFAPVRIGGREYVDGGVWSPTNLDAAVVGRGTRVLCLNPLGALGSGRPGAGALIGAAIHLAEGVEAAVLRRRGATVETIIPDAACTKVMGTNLMAPDSGRAVHHVAYAQGLALGGLGAD